MPSTLHRCAAIIAAVLFAAGAVRASSLEGVADSVARLDWTAAATEAAELDAAAPGGGDYYRALVTATRLASENRCEAALLLVDAMLATRPAFVPAYQLAYRCNMQLGRTASALARLDQLLTLLPPGAERDLVTQLKLNAASADRPVVTLFGEIAPSSNVNRQTAATDYQGFQIAEGARGEPGVLARGGMSISRRLLETNSVFLSGVARIEASYATSDHLFQPVLTLETPLTFSHDSATRFLATPFVSVGFKPEGLDFTRLGVRGVVSLTLDPATQVGLSGSAAHTRYVDEAFRNATRLAVTVSAARQLGEGARLTATASLIGNLTDEPDRRTTELNGGLRYDRLLDNGVILAVEGTLGTRWYAQPPPLSTGDNQLDRFAAIRFEIAHRDLTIGPFMPGLYYQYTRQWSNNAFYDYSSHDVGLTLKAKL